MEMLCSSETSVLTRATWRNIPEDGILHSMVILSKAMLQHTWLMHPWPQPGVTCLKTEHPPPPQVPRSQFLPCLSLRKHTGKSLQESSSQQWSSAEWNNMHDRFSYCRPTTDSVTQFNYAMQSVSASRRVHFWACARVLKHGVHVERLMWAKQWHDCTLAGGEGRGGCKETLCLLCAAVRFPLWLNALYLWPSWVWHLVVLSFICHSSTNITQQREITKYIIN
jgi:hypothetical protein